jgi:hypothetical protein
MPKRTYLVPELAEFLARPGNENLKNLFDDVFQFKDAETQKLMKVVASTVAVDLRRNVSKLGGKARAEMAKLRNKEWQRRADEIWQAPEQSKWSQQKVAGEIREDIKSELSAIAKEIADETDKNEMKSLEVDKASLLLCYRAVSTITQKISKK